VTHAEDDHGSSDLVVVANRLPLGIDEDGGWQRSPGGLVTALEPTLRARKGAWVGWPGRPDVEAEPFDDDGLAIRPVQISADEALAAHEGDTEARSLKAEAIDFLRDALQPECCTSRNFLRDRHART